MYVHQMKVELPEFLDENINEFNVGPSKYRISQNGTNVLDWRIILADNSWRRVILNTDLSAEQSYMFNVHALPIVGLASSWAEDVVFVRYHSDENSLTFGPKDTDSCHVCVPKISYHLSDLSFKIKMILDNLSTFPIYWCPVMQVRLYLPWHAFLSLDQYSLKSKAKKKISLSDDYVILESSKCLEKLQLTDIENNILAVTGFQDPKLSITTKNEEESIYITFSGKNPNACLGLKKTLIKNCTKLLCMADLPNTDDSSDWSRYKCIQSGQSDEFSIELSVF